MSKIWDVWELRQQDTLIARLHITDQDMFWYTASFEAAPAFEPHRALFAVGRTLVDQPEKFDAWYEAAQDLGMYLIRLRDAAKASEFILYVEENEASFRPLFDAI
jgi:hypothetical protein